MTAEDVSGDATVVNCMLLKSQFLFIWLVVAIVLYTEHYCGMH